MVLGEQAINPLIGGGKLVLEEGKIEVISAQLRWPALELKVEGVELVFCLNEVGGDLGVEEEVEEEEIDLEASILEVAEEFVHEEEDGGGGEEGDNIDEERIFGFLPGGFGATREAQEVGLSRLSATVKPEEKVTLLAGVIERILARLGVEVDNVVVRIKVGEGREIKIIVGGFAYGEIEEGREGKAMRVRGLEVFTTTSAATPLPPRPRAAPSSSTSSSDDDDSSSSEEEDEISPIHDMYLSQSIADLRESSFLPPPPTSMYASSINSKGASLYASAHSGTYSPSTQPTEAVEDPFLNPSPPRHNWRPVSPLLPSSSRMIFSLGQQTVEIFLKSPSSIECSLQNPIIILLHPEDLSLLSLIPKSSSKSPPKSKVKKPQQIKFEAEFKITSFHAFLLLPSNTSMSLHTTNSIWKSPTNPLQIPHLHFSANGIVVKLIGEEVVVGVEEFRLVDGEVEVVSSGGKEGYEEGRGGVPVLVAEKKRKKSVGGAVKVVVDENGGWFSFFLL